jgi:hypothetical protein
MDKPIEPEHSCQFLDILYQKISLFADKYNMDIQDRDEIMIMAIAAKCINRELRCYAYKLIKYYEQLNQSNEGGNA